MPLPEDKPPLPYHAPRRVTLTLDIGRPWVVVVWALFIFLTGAISGGAMLHLMRPGPPHGHREGNAALPRDFARRMQRDYRLTDEQAREIEQIVEKYEPRFAQISRDAREQLEADMEQMNQEILPLLNEQQRARHLATWRDVVRPRPEERGDHRRGPPPRRERPR